MRDDSLSSLMLTSAPFGITSAIVEAVWPFFPRKSGEDMDMPPHLGENLFLSGCIHCVAQVFRCQWAYACGGSSPPFALRFAPCEGASGAFAPRRRGFAALGPLRRARAAGGRSGLRPHRRLRRGGRVASPPFALSWAGFAGDSGRTMTEARSPLVEMGFGFGLPAGPIGCAGEGGKDRCGCPLRVRVWRLWLG